MDKKALGNSSRKILEEDERVLKDPAPQVVISNLGGTAPLIFQPGHGPFRADFWDVKWDVTRK